MSVRRALMLSSMVLVLALAIFPMQADADPEVPDVHPEQDYPDADIIISENSEGKTLVMFKAYGEYVVTEDHPSQWFSIVYEPDSDITLRDISQAGDSIIVVFEKTSVSKLTVFNIDSRSAMNSNITVMFKMYSGSIQEFSLMQVAEDVEQYLPTSYDVMNTPIRNAEIILAGGYIGCYNPTSVMLSVTNYSLTVEPGMEIDRLYTTGENGKYSNVSVAVNGGEIGYMTNVSSKIGTLRYIIESGQIHYLSLGANSEHHNSSKKLEELPTSYVTGDVRIKIGSSVLLGKCIIGAGILNMPMILSNGDRLTDPVIHMVIIDAPGVSIYNDNAFVTERRTSAYSLSALTLEQLHIGQNPHAYALLDTVNLGDEPVKVYSDDGVWKSISSSTLPVGGVFSVGAKFFIQTDSEFTVEKGATMYNSDDIMVSGKLIVEGDLINNSVIQCIPPYSSVEGTLTGIGYLADYVQYQTPVSSLSVSSDNTAVVIDLKEMYPVESISAVMFDDRRSVSITTKSSQRIFGDKFMLSLTETEAPEGFDSAFRLDIKGIDRDVLSICNVVVTLPMDKTVCTAVYVYNPVSQSYENLANAEYESQISFVSGPYYLFDMLTYTTERPVPPSDPVEPKSHMAAIDYWLIAAIIAVLAVTIYSLVTMKRD